MKVGRFFEKRRKTKIALVGLVVLVIIAAAAGHKKKPSTPAAAASTPAAAAAVTKPSTPITDKTPGFLQDPTLCIGCNGQLTQYVHVTNVWCAWQGSNVIVHAQFRNNSVETVSIHWHPSYTIAQGGSHGGGLTSIQGLKLVGHSAKGEFVKQRPKGVPPGSRIGSCEPALEDVSSS